MEWWFTLTVSGIIADSMVSERDCVQYYLYLYLSTCTCTWAPRGLLLMNSYLSRRYTETYVEVLHSILRLPLSACEFRMGSSTPTLWYIGIVECKVNSSVSELWLALESVHLGKTYKPQQGFNVNWKKEHFWSKVCAW